MRWPPPLSPNNTARVTDAAFVRATGQPQRFAPFSLPIAFIGPWLSASFDNPAIDTGEPIGRGTLVGDPPVRVRSVTQDTHGAVVALADGAGAQQWEIVSTLEWHADGDAGLSWVFCFMRQLDPVDLVGAPVCENGVVVELDEWLTVRVPAGGYSWFRVNGLPTAGYRVDASGVPAAGGGFFLDLRAGDCWVPGWIGDPALVAFDFAALTAPEPLRLVLHSPGSAVDVSFRLRASV